MEKIEDYNELNKLQKVEGRKVLILYANLIHQVIDGEWHVVGKVDSDGNIKYRRRP